VISALAMMTSGCGRQMRSMSAPCPQHGGEYLRAAVAASPGHFNYHTPLDHWQKLPRDAAHLYNVRCKECENR